MTWTGGPVAEVDRIGCYERLASVGTRGPVYQRPFLTTGPPHLAHPLGVLEVLKSPVWSGGAGLPSSALYDAASRARTSGDRIPISSCWSVAHQRKMLSTMLFAARMSGSFVIPLGSKRMCANFETYTSSGTPYCNP